MDSGEATIDLETPMCVEAGSAKAMVLFTSILDKVAVLPPLACMYTAVLDLAILINNDTACVCPRAVMFGSFSPVCLFSSSR